MSELHACTIASNNYLAMARVFAESYLEHHPGARVFVCVVDEPSPTVSYARLPFTPIFARDLGIPAFRNMAFRYDVMELNTAVKPFFLSYLRDQFGLDRVLYFDPDIVVFDRLDGLAEGLGRASMLLTPHITEPLEDNRSPSERLIRQVGVYNLGFLGLRLDEDTRGFLDWWQRRLHRYCISDPANGLFVDQSWMDLAPALLPGVEVLRDPIYNVAYWNLPHRFPAQRDGRWMLGERPLGFFHFSGFDAADLEAVSRHQNRLRLQDREELRRLFEDYRSRLLDRGFLASQSIPYAYASFDGMPYSIPRFLRRSLMRVDPNGQRWADPFATDVEDSFLGWLEETDEYPAGALPRAALCLWEERWDLKVAFPDVTGSDLGPYARWLRKSGVSEGGLWPSAVESARDHGVLRAKHAAQLSVRRWAGSTAMASPLDFRRPGQGYKWLNQPVTGLARETPKLTTAAMLLHEMRADVQSAFPDPRGDDQARYAHWFVFYGGPEEGLDRRLLAPVARTLPLRQRLKYALLEAVRGRAAKRVVSAAPAERPREEPVRRSAPRALSPGVNLAGYFDMDTGVGQAARGSLVAFEAAGVPVAKLSLDHTVLGGPEPESAAGAPYALSLIHANADQSRRALAELPAAAAAGSIKVGYWFWELAYFPLGFSDRFLCFDEIWAPTQFCAESFRALASVPVRVVPPCVLEPEPQIVDRAALGLDRDRFYFFYSFDVASVPERKHPWAAIEAIDRLARTVRRPVGLILRVLRSERNPSLAEQLRARCRGLPIVLLTERSSRGHYDALLSACDACLSLHRSEGLGMLPIECMYLGKPVVATGYGGVTDYLDETTGFPVDFNLRRLDIAHGPYPAGAAWAEPSIADAVEKMRAVVELPELASERAARARERVRAIYAPEAAGARFAAELDRLLGSPVARRAGLPAGSIAASAAGMAPQVAAGAVSETSA